MKKTDANTTLHYKAPRGGFKDQLTYFTMCAPGLLWLILFSIVPMYGIIMAFQDFVPGKGFSGSEFIGLENFEYLFSMKDAQRVIQNTFIIAISKIVVNLFFPLVFALLLNEVRNLRYKKTVQTIVYLPHFLSWVILASIIGNIFGYPTRRPRTRVWLRFIP